MAMLLRRLPPAAPSAGLFETHDGGATFSPAPHASVQCDGGSDAGGSSSSKGGGGSGGGNGVESGAGGHLLKFELTGAMLGLGLLQASWCLSRLAV